MSDVDPEAFNAFEAEGWEGAAAGYDRFFGPITGRVIEPLLDAAGVTAGQRVLDVASGPGHVAARAAERGADAVGMDVAAAMVELAQRNYPSLRFVRGSAAELPFGDASFEAGVGNFLVLHLGEPERAAAELARVLVPAAGVALTTWDLAERARLFGAVLDAVSEVGVPAPSDVPAGPSFFRFSEESAFRRLLLDAGFVDVRVQTIAWDHLIRTVDELFVGILEGTVRTAALLHAADDEQRARVRNALAARLEPYRGPDGFAVPVSVKLASGRCAP